MGNEQSKGKLRIDPSLEKKLDPTALRIDLKTKNIHASHFSLIDTSQYTNVTWLNLPNNFLDVFPLPLCEVTSLKNLRLSANKIAELPPEIKKLSRLTALDISKNDFHQISDELGQLVALTDLNAHWNDVTHITPGFANLTGLKTLNLSLNKLTDFPPMGDCTKLENIDISHNRISDLPLSFAPFGCLHTLNMAGNRIGSTFKNISVFAGLKSLITLDLQNNEIRTLPPEFACLGALKTLRLRGNAIEILPDCVASLTNLEELEISQNNLRQLPDNFGSLVKLQNCFLYQNKLTEIPKAVGNLLHAKEFGATFNCLKSLPSSLSNLSEVVTFMAGNNELVSLDPEMFVGLTSVQELSLNHNGMPPEPFHGKKAKQHETFTETLLLNIINALAITQIPDTISHLQSLKKLDLSQNQLTAFPACSPLTNLGALELGSNHFTKFPCEILSLNKLQILNLFANRISDLPEEIGDLVCLKKLYLGYNKISSLPSSFHKLTALKDLFLSGNAFAMFPFPILDLCDIQTLALNNNLLEDIPPNIHQITALETLNLNNNKLTKIDGIGKCLKLKELDASHNQIIEFPEDLSKLTSLIDLDLSGNVISNIPEAFEESGAQIHQLKISFNNLSRIPNFTSYQKYGFEESTAEQHVPWVSCTGNTYIRSWYDSDIDAKKLREKHETEAKKSAKKKGSESDTTPDYSDDDIPTPKKTPPGSSESLFLSTSKSQPGTPKPVISSKALPASVTDPPGLGMNRSRGEKAKYLPVLAKKRGKSADSPMIKGITARRGFDSVPQYRHRIGWSETRGRRQDQQDTICVDICFRGNPNRAVLCCFDGHSGEKSSELVSRKILPVLCQRLDEVESVDEAALKDYSANELLFPAHVPTTTNDNQKRSHMADPDLEFLKLEKKKPKKKPKKTKEKLSQEEFSWVLNLVFEDLHRKITKNKFVDGTAALVILIEHDTQRLIVANSGDQRAVLARGDHAVPITTDHKPDEPIEKLRIYHMGGFINEQKRVDGILTLSRSLGDNYLQPHVTYRPDVDFVELAPEDKFLIVACDGLWDVVSNEEAVALASTVSDPCKAAALLVDYAHSLGSGDNISVIVYMLNPKDQRTKLNEEQITIGIPNLSSSDGAPFPPSDGTPFPPSDGTPFPPDEPDPSVSTSPPVTNAFLDPAKHSGGNDPSPTRKGKRPKEQKKLSSSRDSPKPESRRSKDKEALKDPKEKETPDPKDST